MISSEPGLAAAIADSAGSAGSVKKEMRPTQS